jgi:hypothetical protein
LDYGAVGKTVAETFGATLVEDVPKDRIVLAVHAVCGLGDSTFYRKRVMHELWISYCDPRQGSLCLANKVFAFTHERSWHCVEEMFRKQLLNDAERDVKATKFDC